MSNIRKLQIILCLLVLSSCNEVNPLQLPEVNDIAAIEIYEGVLEKREQVQVITDRKVIQEVLEFVKSNNSGWHTTWNTYPTPQATAVFRGQEKGSKMLLWFGPDWVGGHAGPISPKKAYLWEFSASKLQELKSMLGISV